LEAQTNQRARRKRAGHADYRFSLAIQFFFSGEVQENLSLFWVSQAQAAMALRANVDCATQLRSVVRLIGAEHGKQSLQQLSHNRYDGLQPSFAAS
jgi:hypothetical protein